MTRPTSPGEIAAYERDGAVCLRGVFTREWLDLLARGVERNLAEPGPFAKRYTPTGAPGLFFGDYCNWRRIPEYREFLLHSPAAALAGALMRSRKVNLFHEHVLVKEPGTLEPTPWHHDQPYWTVDGDQVCSLWLSLDPVPRQTCPEFVAGSHRWGVWYTPRRFVDNQDHPAEDPNFVPVPDVDANRDAYTLLAWDLEPGDCLVHHGMTVHGAYGNSSPTQRRRAYSVRWTGDDVVWDPRPDVLEKIPPMTPKAVSLQAGDALDSEAFPRLWP